MYEYRLSIAVLTCPMISSIVFSGNAGLGELRAEGVPEVV
jgi:hypothetical protein